MTATRTSLADALVAVGDRWSMLVVEALLGGARRFGDLEDEIDGIAPNILSARLKKLADHGLVSATAYSDRPPRFSYELTDAGRELEAPLRLLEAWAERHTHGREPPRHEACGAALEVAWYCPTCREVVADGAGEDELHYA